MRLATTPLHASRGLRMAIVALSLTVAAATCASALALRLEIVPAAGQSESPRRISPGVMAGNATYQKRPVYPPEAKEKHITGAIVLHAIITKQGNVDKLEVVSGPDDLRASALDAVKDWRYKPYLLNGQPTAVETTITVNYQLQK